MTQQQYYYGTGRRKTAIARVRVYNTPGGSTVNGKPIDEVFTVGAWLRQAISPLNATNLADDDGNETNTDFDKMMRIVLDAGYRGYVGIEYEGSKTSEVEGIKATKALLERVRAKLA